MVFREDDARKLAKLVGRRYRENYWIRFGAWEGRCRVMMVADDRSRRREDIHCARNLKVMAGAYVDVLLGCRILRPNRDIGRISYRHVERPCRKHCTERMANERGMLDAGFLYILGLSTSPSAMQGGDLGRAIRLPVVPLAVAALPAWCHFTSKVSMIRVTVVT